MNPLYKFQVYIKAGDYFITRTSFSFVVNGPATSVSPKQVSFAQHGGKRIANRTSILFAGPEKICMDIYSTLLSSERTLKSDQAEANRRHQDRINKIILAGEKRIWG